MKRLLKELTLLNLSMAVVYLLVNITSIIVVTSIMGLNIPLAFIMCGVNTILFNYLTKNKIPAFVGISGGFIGATLLVSKTQGVSYAMGGVVMGGIIYLILSLILVKYQEKMFSVIPQYILSTAIILLSLTLIPIGSSLIKANLLTGLVAVGSMVLIELLIKNKIVKLFSMPISILVSSIFHWVMYGMDLTPLSKPLVVAFTTPQFSLSAFLTISIITLAVMYEAIGDTSFISEVCEVDVVKDIGFHRMFLALGIGGVLNGMVGASVPTSYSENISAVRLTKHKNPYTHVFTGLLFILLGLSPFVKYILVIPQASFGGVLLFLFATVMTSGINGLIKSKVNFDTNHKALIVVSLMFSIFFVEFVIGGVTISSMALAVIVGILLNLIIPKSI